MAGWHEDFSDGDVELLDDTPRAMRIVEIEARIEDMYGTLSGDDWDDDFGGGDAEIASLTDELERLRM